MEVVVKDTKLIYENGNYTVVKNNYMWKSDDSFEAGIVLNNERVVLFSNAKTIQVELYESGVGKGILTRYRDIKGVNFAFDTLVWIEESTQNILFEWIVVNDNGFDIKEVMWPNPFVFNKDNGYSLIPYMQGVLLPNKWNYQWDKIAFDGQFCSSAAYMPFLSQIENGHGYIMINETPWDARYVVDHKSDVCGTKLSIRWLSSLSKMNYKRVLRYSFYDDCDYNDICKVYKQYVQETGLFTTLKEKNIRNSYVDKLIGRMFVHTKVKTHISKKSDFYIQDNSESNDSLMTFQDKIKQIQLLKQAGAHKLYVHLDGWGEFGYDNAHPDILPACTQAGGWKGFKELSDMLETNDDMFGLHDQYRDYYHDAKSYDKRFAVQSADGSYYEHARWAGGPQNYLCASLAKSYVKRNVEEVLAKGIHLEGYYLDVFTCNELDECANPAHRMTRKECMNARNECFDYLTSKNILPSSEECCDWAMKSLVFAHYGPYEFMLKEENADRMGVPVPLFNLVYHDCMILPWPIDKNKEDYMLYALLNGGAPYLIREGAYPNTDGCFKEDDLSLSEKIQRSHIVSTLHQKIAYEEMVKHEFLDSSYQIQKTTFADGTTVTIDLNTNKYTIK